MVMINIYFFPFFDQSGGLYVFGSRRPSFHSNKKCEMPEKNPNKQTNNVSEEEEVEQQENKKKIYVQKQMLESLNSL